MADNNGKGSGNSNYFRNNFKCNSDDEDSGEEHALGASAGPDIGLGNIIHHVKKSPTEVGSSAGSGSSNDQPRQENPFSFKHFLNPDSSGGARPKVYPTQSPPTPRLIANPELTSGLPDFVQDHLVIEQCYLNQPTEPLSLDMNNLAEFDPEAPSDSWNPSRPLDLPFDLTANRHEPSFDRPAPPLNVPGAIPFDLPCKPSNQGDVGIPTGLPDFLSDRPIHSGRRPGSCQTPSEPSSLSPERASSPPQPSPIQLLQEENERLRRDQDSLRRQVQELARRKIILESELRIVRAQDHVDTTNLEDMVRHVEENLLHAQRRAEVAELNAGKLEQEVKLLKMKLSELRSGACRQSSERGTHDQLASELRAAAISAERSLRQMLSGVDTLRMIASTLENKLRFEEQHDYFRPDEPDEPEQPGNRDDSGPAL